MIVREWHASVGSRFHGDFQGLENWSGRLDILDELRAAGIETDFDCHPIHDGCDAPPCRGGHPVIGEQAGFQDALAGFGMRYALRSGILAARSLIEGADYTRFWRRELWPLLRTGVANRFIFNTIGERGWAWALRGLSRSDSGEKLRRLYQPSLLSRLVYPLAAWRYRAPLSDPSCDHAHCACIWCTHGAQEVAECPI